MANRFGRNQKRKLREQLEQQKEAYNREAELLRYMSYQHNSDIGALREVQRVLGGYTALLEAKHRALQGVKRGQSSITVAKINANKSYYAPPDDQIASNEVLRSNVLWLLNMVHDDDPITNALHLEFQWEDERVGYAISKEAMQQLPEDILVSRISEAVAKLLVDNIKMRK